MVLIVNVAKDVVTGNGMTAIREDEQIDVAIVNNDRLFLIVGIFDG